MNQPFHGIVAALVTPFSKDGGVNYGELKKLVRFLIGGGVDGFYVDGSSAETFLLTEKERKNILETVIEENNGEKFVICHVGSISTDAAVGFAKHAESAGADAISAISPFYYKFSKEEIIQYYKDIMQSSALPMFLYNFPAFSGFSLTEDVLDELKTCGNLAGVKYTSSDYYLMERMKTKNPGLVLWNGFDEMLLAGLMMGADGGIGSTYNCMAPLIRNIFDSFRAGDIALAQSYQRRANAIIETMLRYGVFASVKTILGFQGLDLGGCRKPFAPMPPEGEKALRAVYVQNA
ncbi:MAG TPA: N-acetylneuraminate lyase [Eubacteriales bacterium]|nr:N-acetylneuraminate lyase [Eubacteriales bacterium]